MNARIDKTCYRILQTAGAIPGETLDRLRQEAENGKIPLGDYVVDAGAIPEKKLLELYAENTGRKCVDLKDVSVDRSVIERIPAKFVWYYKFFPIQIKNSKLVIAVSFPLDVHTLDEMRFGLGFEVETLFAPKKQIEDMLNQHYGLGADTVNKILTQTPKKRAHAPMPASEDKEEDIEKMAETASVVQLVNQILLEAYKKRASDIHIEPIRGAFRLRYRIDGVLQEMKVPPEMSQFMLPIISRIKIMANLNIVERRLPQDGKVRVKTQEQALNLRVSTVPTPHGESIVIRLLPTRMITSLEDLGFEPDVRKNFEELIKRPHGILFVTGPTGSGKSTTLYAALGLLNTIDKKIITLEDPIEYEMQGMIQMQMLPEIDLTFARGLRSVLRHDPDVMMVGEVRDLETADTAIRVALTGHLILSTLHTNDAASGVTRLLDIGIEPYLIASSVIGFMGQRLLRVLCPQCKKPDRSVLPEIQRMIRHDLNLTAETEELKLYKPVGCDQCAQSGYSGRVAIHELMQVTDEIRRLIIGSASADQIKTKARELGMRTLRQDGWKKVIRGVTTPDEVMRSTPMDEKSITVLARKVDAESDYIILPAALNDKSTPQSEENQIRERRKYIRVHIQLDIIFRALDMDAQNGLMDSAPSARQGEGESDNISAGGIAFHTHEKLFPGDILEIKINLSDGQEMVEAIGRVLRVSQTTEKDSEKSFSAAVAFLAIHSNDRLRIENFCKNNEKNK